MLNEDFNHTIDSWIKGLERYDFIQLCAKPSSEGWSIGQLYMHLIENTVYYLEQIRICVSTDDHENEEASPAAKRMFLNNDFPDEMIEGPASNALTPQPPSKDHVLASLLRLRNEANEAAILISNSTFRGKTKHPGLQYFNASEWFQFAEMHFRHHLRQKKRIDEFLEMKMTG